MDKRKDNDSGVGTTEINYLDGSGFEETILKKYPSLGDYVRAHLFEFAYANRDKYRKAFKKGEFNAERDTSPKFHSEFVENLRREVYNVVHLYDRESSDVDRIVGNLNNRFLSGFLHFSYGDKREGPQHYIHDELSRELYKNAAAMRVGDTEVRGFMILRKTSELFNRGREIAKELGVSPEEVGSAINNCSSRAIKGHYRDLYED